jgi:hypothetical protein
MIENLNLRVSRAREDTVGRASIDAPYRTVSQLPAKPYPYRIRIVSVSVSRTCLNPANPAALFPHI